MIAHHEPLWRRALVGRWREQLARSNRGARARVVLRELLRECGVDVSLVTVRLWSREQQGQAYLWAIDRKSGGHAPRPSFLPRAS
jgi:hypothetical protein